MSAAHPATTRDQQELLTETEVAARLKTSVASVRWMRRTGRLGYIKIAGNRKVRFAWRQVLEDLRAAEVRATRRKGRARTTSDASAVTPPKSKTGARSARTPSRTR
jgi:hypothetical protein